MGDPVEPSRLIATEWDFEPRSEVAASRLLYLAFKDWQRANRLGLRLRSVVYQGTKLTAHEMDLLNYWVEAGGALNCQKMGHWEAVRFFERTLLREHPLAKWRPPEKKGRASVAPTRILPARSK